MGELVHVSKVKVYKEPGKGKVKKAYIEGFPEPILTGVNGGIKGYIENVENKPLITRVHVKYHLKVPQGKKAEAQRAIDHHEQNCAVSQTIRHGITIEFEGEIEEE